VQPGERNALFKCVDPAGTSGRTTIPSWPEEGGGRQEKPEAQGASDEESHDAARARIVTGSSPVARNLDELATRPGAEGLRLLAACWRIGAERGGTLATVLDGLAGALRDEEAQRQDVAVQLAGPRATARLLALLPLLGLGMAAALGAHPIPFLCSTLPGLACLITGISLNLLGLHWTRRLAKSAESPH
jgi:tight adherence protein B